jgi:(p)ppGpp synthase/HD superfamily hydrolase
MMKLKEKYILASCCSPAGDDSITGYYSHNNIIKVHRSGCSNLKKADPARLIELNWEEVIAPDDFKPDDDYNKLDETDFLILKHHRIFGVDYSLKVAAMYRLDKQLVFESHKKLRAMDLLERVKPVMMQYRKGIVDNKWIKHRNHTYYELTDKGRNYLEYNIKNGPHS